MSATVYNKFLVMSNEDCFQRSQLDDILKFVIKIYTVYILKLFSSFFWCPWCYFLNYFISAIFIFAIKFEYKEINL